MALFRSVSRITKTLGQRTMPAVSSRSFADRIIPTADDLNKKPVKVAVTGAAGNIGYAILFRIAAGEMLGARQPVELQLLELPNAEKALEGVRMELYDCAFPLLKGITCSTDAKSAFEGADYGVLIGAKPRTKGMERADLLLGNAEIFKVQGKALNEVANRTCKVCVVGNPCNTNALITSHFAPNIPTENITAMTKLDHNRGIAQLAEKAGVAVTDFQKFAVWGNHSPTMYPSIQHAFVKGKPAAEVFTDTAWYNDFFMPKVQKRGAEIIGARGASSAASAANAAVDHIREWVMGTDDWTSIAIRSDGSYGIDEGIWFSFPVTAKDGAFHKVTGLDLTDYSKAKIDITRKELVAERNDVSSLLV